MLGVLVLHEFFKIKVVDVVFRRELLEDVLTGDLTVVVCIQLQKRCSHAIVVIRKLIFQELLDPLDALLDNLRLLAGVCPDLIFVPLGRLLAL